MKRITTLVVALVSSIVTQAWAGPKTDWPTFGFDAKRSGANPSETTLAPGNVGSLRQVWEFDAVAFAKRADPRPETTTGEFYAQPIVASSVETGRGRKDLVLIGDNDGLFFALDANSQSPRGAVVWSRTVPLVHPKCPTAEPAGIMSTAVIDRLANGRHGAVYVAANAKVHAFDLATGRTLEGWPADGLVIPQLTPAQDGFIRAGLTLVNGALYVTNSSRCDDPPFHGQIARIDTGSVTVTAQWFAMSGDASVPARSGGSIWGPGGVAIDTNDVHPSIYTATGNGMPPRANAEVLPLAEAVIQLTPDLSSLVGYHQVGFIVPDDDFGSTPVLFEPQGCPSKLLAVQQKSGLAYIYRRHPVGQVAPQTIRLNNSTFSFRGNPAWDAAAQTLVFANSADGPAPYGRGLVGLQRTVNCEFGLAWQVGTDLSGNPMIIDDTPLSPVSIANGVAYFGVAHSRVSRSTYRLFAVADATVGSVHAGQVLWESEPMQDGVVSGPIVVNGRLFVASYDGHVSAYEPAPM